MVLSFHGEFQCMTCGRGDDVKSVEDKVTGRLLIFFYFC